MAIDKITSAGITTDAVGPTQLNEAANYAFTGTVTGAGEANTPAWFANKTDTTSVATTTTTKATFNVEIVDTDNAFASSTFTVPSGKAGKYYVFGQAQFGSHGDQDYVVVFIYINGSIQAKGVLVDAGGADIATPVFAIFDLSVGDTVELYVRHNYGSNRDLRGETQEKTTIFGGYRISS
tara:strand:+ start:52 stop:591 length:540 start_codon:yes stop_codon:yes gene_type:complete